MQRSASHALPVFTGLVVKGRLRPKTVFDCSCLNGWFVSNDRHPSGKKLILEDIKLALRRNLLSLLSRVLIIRDDRQKSHNHMVGTS